MSQPVEPTKKPPKSATQKEWKPRITAVEKLYAENWRLQRLCRAHRQQIRGMQKNLQLYKLIIEAHIHKTTGQGSTLAYRAKVEKQVKASLDAYSGDGATAEGPDTSGCALTGTIRQDECAQVGCGFCLGAELATTKSGAV